MIKATDSGVIEEAWLSGLADSAAEETKQWYALYTRSRHEKIVACELNKRGIENFLPLRKLKRHWSDRTKTIEDPLFHGYLFTRIPIKEKFAVLNTCGAVSFVHFGPNLPAVIPDRDIAALRRFTAEELPMDPFPYLSEGQRVCVRSGVFKGVEGYLVRKNQQCRLVISLDVLMQSISIELDSSEIEPV